MAPIVALTGFMGSGKTTVGRKTARLLKWDFIDLDEEVVSSCGRDIASIFATNGEDVFRRLEFATLTEVLEKDRVERGLILALGGGTVTSSNARLLLKGRATIVYLEVDADTAWRRVSSSARPLARDREAFTHLLAARQALYEAAADHVVQVAGRTSADIALQLARIAKGLAGDT